MPKDALSGNRVLGPNGLIILGNAVTVTSVQVNIIKDEDTMR